MTTGSRGGEDDSKRGRGQKVDGEPGDKKKWGDGIRGEGKDQARKGGKKRVRGCEGESSAG